MINTAQLLYCTVTAVVVCHHESFGRYDLGGTTVSEVYDSVFQTRTVNVINLFGRKLATKLFHLFLVQFFQKWQ
ncbi:hypothetical protein SDC9_125991 [bioreactor metagenome]|uniref:Uncharacterized protein n=1 Tax=bioreactor metagenome TaxID=1076179 RepID=A0A645CPI3_9ZZZZ